jgi:hypothetical protein
MQRLQANHRYPEKIMQHHLKAIYQVIRIVPSLREVTPGFEVAEYWVSDGYGRMTGRVKRGYLAYFVMPIGEDALPVRLVSAIGNIKLPYMSCFESADGRYKFVTEAFLAAMVDTNNYFKK